MTRTLLLDLDGTLVDSAPDLLASANRLMQARGLPPFAMPDLRAMIGDGVAVLVQRLMQARARTATAADQADFLADYLPHLADATRPYPGIEPALHRLVAQGWRLAVCTNKPAEAARRLLAALGLLPLMAAVGGGDSYPVRKPDPGHLLATLADAGGTPGAALLLGDHANDVMAADAARIPCLFAAWGYGTPAMAQGAAVVPDPQDIPAFAARLLPG